MEKNIKLSRSNRFVMERDYFEPVKKYEFQESDVLFLDEPVPKKKSPFKLAKHIKKQKELKLWVYLTIMVILMGIIAILFNKIIINVL